MRDQQGNHRRASDILVDLARNAPPDRVSLRYIVEELGDRAFGLLMLMFAMPNAVGLGAIPGLSTVFGLPQMFIAAQMLMGRERLWLPGWLLDRAVSRADFQKIVDKSTPYMRKVERVLRPRWNFLSTKLAEQVLGAVFLILAIIVSLPIPLANQPPGVAMAVIAIGLIARDGLYVIVGFFVAVIAAALAAAVVLGGAAAILTVIRHLFGG